MKPNFEIKYLELKWYNKETLTKIVESMNTLDLEFNEQRQSFVAETTIYPKLNGIDQGHLAIRFFTPSNEPPFIDMPNGERNYLSPIQDPETGIIWWIAKDKWVKAHRQWFGVAPNIVGKLQLTLREQRCEILINGSDFTHDQLERYLQTFKNDLWELILDEDSPVNAEVKESKRIGINDKVIEYINSLVHHAKLIARSPKTELREVQKLQPRKFVKPVNRTFMELTTKTNHRFLTSRASVPSYNVAENRYILFALERCYRIIKQVVTLANNKSQRYSDTIEKLNRQYASFSSHQIEVNRDLVVADLQILRERCRVEYWQNKIQKKIEQEQLPLQANECDNSLILRLEQHTTQQNTDCKNGFFVKIWDGEEWQRPNEKTGILRLAGHFEKLTEILEPSMIVRVNCDYDKYETERSVMFKIECVHAIEIIDSLSIQRARAAFEKEKEIGKKLAANNWVKPLSKQELEEQEKEKRAIENRIHFYTRNQALAAYVFDKVAPKVRALKKLIAELRQLRITSSSHFPNSMTFVQNPHYQGVHKSYKLLREITNLNDDDILVNLEEIDRIGLVNMPLLYERWVLLQIVLTLKNIFRFTPDGRWKYQLIEAIKTNNKDIQLKLSNSAAKRFISLWYEKSLPNNCRPDFMLDLTWYSQNDSDLSDKNFQRFVLDAKFYDKSTFSRAGGMMAKIDELYLDKNYSENSINPVFLIHPCGNLIEQQLTSQVWGKYSFLGEANIEGQDVYPSHNKGAILLNPIDREIYADELQRLLGLFLQYKLESSETARFENDCTLAVPICIRCGSTHIKQIQKSTGYHNKRGEWIVRTPRSVWMQCSECEQVQIYNHCANSADEGTRLIKNGLYWSYHSARAIEPFNMKCPTCGEWGAW